MSKKPFSRQLHPVTGQTNHTLKDSKLLYIWNFCGRRIFKLRNIQICNLVAGKFAHVSKCYSTLKLPQLIPYEIFIAYEYSTIIILGLSRSTLYYKHSSRGKFGIMLHEGFSFIFGN